MLATSLTDELVIPPVSDAPRLSTKLSDRAPTRTRAARPIAAAASSAPDAAALRASPLERHTTSPSPSAAPGSSPSRDCLVSNPMATVTPIATPRRTVEAPAEAPVPPRRRALPQPRRGGCRCSPPAHEAEHRLERDREPADRPCPWRPRHQLAEEHEDEEHGQRREQRATSNRTAKIRSRKLASYAMRYGIAPSA